MGTFREDSRRAVRQSTLSRHRGCLPGSSIACGTRFPVMAPAPSAMGWRPRAGSTSRRRGRWRLDPPRVDHDPGRMARGLRHQPRGPRQRLAEPARPGRFDRLARPGQGQGLVLQPDDRRRQGDQPPALDGQTPGQVNALRCRRPDQGRLHRRGRSGQSTYISQAARLHLKRHAPQADRPMEGQARTGPRRGYPWASSSPARHATWP